MGRDRTSSISAQQHRLKISGGDRRESGDYPEAAQHPTQRVAGEYKLVENTTTAQMEVAPQLTQKLLVDGLTTRLRQITKGKHGKNNQSSILDFPKLTQKCGIVFVTFTLQQKHSPAAVGPEGRKQVSFKGRRGSHRFFPSCALGGLSRVSFFQVLSYARVLQPVLSL